MLAVAIGIGLGPMAAWKAMDLGRANAVVTEVSAAPAPKAQVEKPVVSAKPSAAKKTVKRSEDIQWHW